MSNLYVTSLEERALPAASFLVPPVTPPIMFVVGTPPAMPQNANLADKPIVRLDVTADGAADAPPQDVSEMMTNNPGTPPPETNAAAPPTAEELAILEAEWMAMQEVQMSV